MFKRQINLDRRDLRLISLNSHYTLIQKSLYKDDYREPVFEYRARIFKLLRSPGINSKESIPLAYVARWAGTTTLLLLCS
jgi:hypothetical protein